MNGDKPTGVLDGILAEVRDTVDIYSVINPVNWEEEKEKFERQLSGTGLENVEEIEDPEFEYGEIPDLDREQEVLDRGRGRLEQAELEPAVETMYRETFDELEALMELAENIGDPETVREASAEIYGEPSPEAVDWAEAALEEIEPGEQSEPEYGPGEVRDTMERALDALGLDWRVEFTESRIVSVNAADRKVRVPEEREFTARELARLPVHEIGVHAIRGANGYEQDFEVMGSGAGFYHLAEEGLALLMEEEAGVSDPQVKREYAGRLLSVQSVLDGDSFAETYQENREHGFGHDDAMEIARRAHRGGGFIKDHIYAEGFLQVHGYLEKGGEIDDLFAGKISVDQAEELSESGSVGEPAYDPAEVVQELASILPEGVPEDVYSDADGVPG